MLLLRRVKSAWDLKRLELQEVANNANGVSELRRGAHAAILGGACLKQCAISPHISAALCLLAAVLRGIGLGGCGCGGGYWQWDAGGRQGAHLRRGEEPVVATYLLDAHGNRLISTLVIIACTAVVSRLDGGRHSAVA